MSLKNSLAKLAKDVEVHIEELDVDLKIRKLTVPESSDFDKLTRRLKITEKGGGNVEKLVEEILKRYVRELDGSPVIGDEDAEAVMNMLPTSAAKAILHQFKLVNGDDDDEDSKKKS